MLGNENAMTSLPEAHPPHLAAQRKRLRPKAFRNKAAILNNSPSKQVSHGGHFFFFFFTTPASLN